MRQRSEYNRGCIAGKDKMDRVEKFVLIMFVLLAFVVFCGKHVFACESPSAEVYETKSPEPTESPEPTVPPTQTPALEEPENNEDQFDKYYTEAEVIMVAKVLYDECRGILSDTEKACVAWTICNRVDAGYGATIAEVITAPGQFAYRSCAPVWDNLYALAEDVLSRWSYERNGVVHVGRVLPPDYLWYSGDGAHNYFRNSYSGMNGYWNYSSESPYSS